jgi:5-methylthioadenosine/S-adenosylhomocysteine deaminase
MGKTICIRDCSCLVAWNASAKRHEFRTSADIAFSGDEIVFIGDRYTGPVDDRVDGRGLMVAPGFINIHTHPSMEPGYKGIREEHGVPEMHMSGLFERLAVFNLDEDGLRASAETAFCEMLMSGVTTVADLSIPYEGWLNLLARSGMRVYAAPWYASARWYVQNRHELKYRWDEAAGRRGFAAALKLIDEAQAHPSGRLSGVIFPAQIDTCSEDLLRDSVAAARERKLPFTTHAAQSVAEFNVIVQRYGVTPIQWAHRLGLLGPQSIIAHAIFIDEHSWLHWSTRRDIDLLADSGASVAHCPTPFARYGQLFENLGKFIRRGVNIGIGTDTTPHNMIEEMRWAAVLGRIAAEDMFAVTTEEVLHAATVGGAAALMREDIGRLAVGCKADLVLVDLSHPLMKPARDPLRSLIYYAADRVVRDVYVGGALVVKNGAVVTLDFDSAAQRLEESQKRMLSQVSTFDYAGRSGEEIAPLSLHRAAAT